MHPSPAEITRTLATGRLGGYVRTPRNAPARLRHATLRDGTTLMLVRDGGAAAESLARPGDDVAAVLCVDDVPPLTGSPSLGRLWLSGWACPLEGEEARAAAVEFAEVNPAGDLLSLGEGYTLHRLDVAEVRLERSAGLAEVDVDAYLAAEPDPVAAWEAELLADLADHHAEQIGAFAGKRLAAGPDDRPPRVVRLDRYGMAFAMGDGRYARVGFAPPVSCRADLVGRMRGMLGMDGCRHAA
ncbi:hypothetical protein Afil01_08680 [Actinorhabdospora filicis]|uniref:DUF2470 domain-containing protein n=1 Tax=Actinorhabdospora filicis TaxID=1785913 RepID=A0A9W6SK25_9ACTN|nr:DUF2470 domain-containing protein [Actinorhabdospora filicis]GLZ76061.1 hypothetical protein Afil01_08680 [Actinorhabdospora filicis]